MSGIERAAGFRVFIYYCSPLDVYAEPRAVSRSRLGARVYLYLRPKTRIRVFKAIAFSYQRPENGSSCGYPAGNKEIDIDIISYHMFISNII